MTPDAVLIETIDRHFGAHPSTEKIGVAVSGGSDSLALLYLLVEWGRASLSVATVNHGLRVSAAGEAAQVGRICEELGLSHTTLEWQGWDGRGNLQDHARRNRYALLAGWAKEGELDCVALGHTQDDQAETFLMRLARESGLDGLTGMEPETHRHGIRFDRPLLRIGRDSLRNYLSRRGVTWIDDPSNEDDRFDRIKARKALDTLGPLGISPETITETVNNLRFERLLIVERAQAVARDIIREDAGDLIFDRARFRRLNPELQRRLLAAALKWVASEDYPPRRDSLREVDAAIREERNVTLHGCQMLISAMTVRITREFNAVRSCTCATKEVWDGRWRLDGPHADDLEVRALGEGINACPDWRATGHPRQSLIASPAIWRAEALIAAPIAGLKGGWTAKTPDRDHFAASLISR